MMFDKTAHYTIFKKLQKNLTKNQKIIATFAFGFTKTVSFKSFFVVTILFSIACLVSAGSIEKSSTVITSSTSQLQPVTVSKSQKEVFGFAPYWTIHKLDNVDFNVLTTMAYFSVDVNSDGNLQKSGPGYDSFESKDATDIFKKAHQSGTRVVLTLTAMNNNQILALLSNLDAENRAIDQATQLVKSRGIDGVNLDFEYLGDPGDEYRMAYNDFARRMVERMHDEIPSSKVTVSVYAASVKERKLYDIAYLGKNTDGVFMMAYDFASVHADNAIPTAPLYGYKEGKYWYDVSTAVNDFLTQMPANKLILGVPWYGYNYAVSSPTVKAATNKGYYQYYRRGRRSYSYYVPYNSFTQTYSSIQNDIADGVSGISSYRTGWDDEGKVSYKAYYSNVDGIWRMVFVEDSKSLGLKYDFAKDKDLLGVGIWALGFDSGKGDMWEILDSKFGTKLADISVFNKAIFDGVSE